MKTDYYIAALLYDHDCVIVTGFGGFVASYESAQLNELQHTFYPPSKKIAFNASLKNNDGLLANHISAKENIAYTEACTSILKFTEDCFQELDTGKKINLDEIGLLFYDAERNIQFIPDPFQNFLKDSFGLTFVHSPAINAEEEILPVKDVEFSKTKKGSKFNWRIIELIPAAAIVVLMFTFPIITKKFDSQLSSVNPFADRNKVETPAAIRKFPSKEKINPESVFYKPPVKKEITKTETPAAENIPKEIKDTAVNVEQPNVAASSPVIEKSSVPVAPAPDSTTGLKYHIIAGCFRIEENATKLEADLKSKGFKAGILGKNNAGLTMVSISSYENLQEAKNSLTEIQNTFNSSVWIFKSK